MDADILNSKLIETLSENIDKISDEYEEYLSKKFYAQAPKDDSLFFSIIEKKTNEAKRKCLNAVVTTFKDVCSEAELPVYKSVIKSIRTSVSGYFDSAFSSMKQMYTSATLRFRASYAEDWLREQLFNDVAKAQSRLAEFAPKVDSIIKVGKRSFSLKHYLDLVSESEVRNKFNINLLKHASNTGAKSIKISSHNTRCSKCAPFEGKTYNLPGDLEDLLKDGLPPYHPNCKHFIIPIYK